jgi:hypothetical protein
MVDAAGVLCVTGSDRIWTVSTGGVIAIVVGGGTARSVSR